MRQKTGSQSKKGVHGVTVQEIKPRCGGKVRIIWERMPTAEEAKARQEAIYRACVDVLANAVSAYGEEETLRRMNSAMYHRAQSA